MLFQLWKASTNHEIEEFHCMILCVILCMLRCIVHYCWRGPEKVPEHTRRTVWRRRAFISQLWASKLHFLGIFYVILQDVVCGHKAGSPGSKLHMQRPSAKIDAIGKWQFYSDNAIRQPPFLCVCGEICEPRINVRLRVAPQPFP